MYNTPNAISNPQPPCHALLPPTPHHQNARFPGPKLLSPPFHQHLHLHLHYRPHHSIQRQPRRRHRDLLILVLLPAISWLAISRIRAHRAALRDAEAHRLSAAVARNHGASRSTTVGNRPANGIIGYRVFKVERDVSREEWVGKGGVVATLPRYEERGSVGVLSERERERERQRRWGSVAAHGTTTRVEGKLPPLPPSPMPERLPCPAPVRAPDSGGFRNGIWNAGKGRSGARQESIDGGPPSRDEKVEK
ncbi:hypothetical protein PMIN01_08874 [Paraphaeosphaeria minitans]|uniref:Uncharacterized protein n=1 Tax=Paraphaeosphaeria minitans TaxID=565426 RepID=A0A9P6GCK2_9PLEO|nr:hypothetical protein PMIN01_08874 [Paraphaeosphaeria minitans]